MLPAIAEVVGVLERALNTRDNLPQPHLALVDNLALVQVVLRVGRAVNTSANHEIVEVTIFPAHDDLQYPVQLSQSRIFSDLDAPPDRRMNVAQRHLEL